MRTPGAHYTHTTIWDVLEARERSDAWLARKVGCSPSLICRIRSGERRIPLWFAERAAAAVDLPESVVFSGLVRSTERTPTSEESAA